MAIANGEADRHTVKKNGCKRRREKERKIERERKIKQLSKRERENIKTKHRS